MSKGIKSKCSTFSYTMRFLCYVSMLALAAVAVFSVFTAYQKADKYATQLKDYQAQTQQIDQLSQRITALEQATAQPDAGMSFRTATTKTPEATNPAAPTTIESAISVMQNQYNGFLTQTSFLLTVIAIVTALITILLPIFNYSFVQKDQVKKMEKKANKFDNDIEKIKTEFVNQLDSIEKQSNAKLARLEKMIQQGTKANEAVLETDKHEVQIPSLSDSPNDQAQALFMQALVNIRQKDYLLAYEALSNAISLDSENARYYNLRGVTLHNMMRYEEAIEDDNKAIELDPENATLYNSRGATLQMMKRYEAALADEEKAIALDPANARCYDSYGIMLRIRKRYGEALAAFQKAWQFDQKMAEYPARIARCYIDLHDTTQAKPFLDQALSLDPTDPNVIRARGLYHLALARDGLYIGSVEEMQVDFDQAIAADDSNPYVFIERAKYFLFTNQPDLALQDLTTAQKLDPLEPEVDHAFALCYEAKGDAAKAAEYHALAAKHGYISDL